MSDVQDPPIHVPWTSRQGLALHVTMLVVVAGCLAATWWQAHRALAGNGLSWAYTFEWPCFAAFAVVLWWRMLHDPERAAATPAARARRQVPSVAQREAVRAEVARAAERGDWHP